MVAIAYLRNDDAYAWSLTGINDNNMSVNKIHYPWYTFKDCGRLYKIIHKISDSRHMHTV